MQLFPYQVPAFDRIVEQHRLLLAFEMGLGKTVTTIAATERLMDDGVITAPVLVITLSGLKFQWAKEIERFGSTALVVDGTPKQRAEQYAMAAEWWECGVDYIVVNYDQVVRDIDTLRALDIGAVVVDEATMIKGFRAQRAKLVKELGRRVPVRVALTGTPVENGKPEELFSIMEFVEPRVLGRYADFDAAYIVRYPWGQVNHYKNLKALHARLGPWALRKRQTDPDVRDHLPAVHMAEPRLVAWDRAGSGLYRDIAEDLLVALDDAAEVFGSSTPMFNLDAHYGTASQGHDPVAEAARGRVMGIHNALRMLCDHPDLLRLSANRFLDGLVTGRPGGSAYCAELLRDGRLPDKIAAPKLTALTDIVLPFLDRDPLNKAVIFSAFVPTLALINEAVPHTAVLYDGSMSPREKDAARVRFRTDPECRLLISSDAGGFGVDLPEANLLINYGLPWTAGAAAQRNSRIIRASSVWPQVRVETLLMDGSVEVRQHEAIAHKLAVSEAVVDGRGINAKGGVDTTVKALRDSVESFFADSLAPG